jgi:hypothetical protein
MLVFIERGDSTVFGKGGSWLLDCGFPFPEREQPCDPEHGPQYLLGCGFTLVEWTCLLVLRSYAPMLRGKND